MASSALEEGMASATHFRSSGQGEPLVLIHGVGLDLSIWDEMAPLLESRYRVICYDMLGHGRSPKPPGPYCLEDFVRQLAALADHLGLEPFNLAGFSMGGMVAQAFAVAFPQRLRRLALLNVVYDRSPAQRAAVLERLRLSEVGGYAASVEAAIERWFTPSFAARRPERLAAIRRQMLANDLPAYLASYRLFATADPDLPPMAQAIRCPALVLTGAEDVGSTAAMAGALAGRLVDSRLVILPGLRHMAPVEAPKEVAGALLAFLGGA